MKGRAKAREAILWGAGFRVFRDIVGFAVSLRLARLLSPSEYGLFGLMNSAMGFLSLFSARTFISYIVQVRDGEDPHVDDQFTAGLAIQGVVAAAVLGVAFVLSKSDTYAPVAPLLAVYSIALLWELTNDLHMKMLERELDFRRQRTLYAAGVVVSAALSLGMAEFGAGVWALVVPAMLSAAPFTVDLFMGRRWRPQFTFRWERYRTAVRFGASRLGSGLVSGLRDLTQSALIVRSAGFGVQGLLGRAMGVGNLATASIASQLVGSVYPILTRFEPGSEKFRRASGLVLQGVAWLVIPLGAGLAIAGPDLIPLLYGARWTGITVYLPATLAECVTRSLSATVYFVLLAGNEQRKCLLQDGMVAILVFALIFAVLRRDVIAYVWGLAAIEAAGAVLMVCWARARRLLDLGATRRAVAAPIIVVFVAAAILTPSGVWLNTQGRLTRIGAVFVVFGLALVGVYRFAFAGALGELLGFLPGGARMARMLRLPGDGMPLEPPTC